MFRIWLMVTVLLSPLACKSVSVFLFASLVLVPAIAVFLIRKFARTKAPAKYAENFRNIVLAHRGGQAAPGTAAGVFPENTMAAFAWAASPACEGADGFELDVWLSKDGVPMVNHDPNIFRHFDGEGFINDMTVKQLKAIKYLPVFHKLNTGEEITIDDKYIQSERMPTLEEVMIFLEKKAPHTRCMIEVKERANVSGMCRALKDLYSRYPWMYERTFVAAFNPLVVMGVRDLDANIVTSFLFINEWSKSLIKNAKDMRIAVPWWLEYNYPLRWTLDDLIWGLGTNRWGLDFLGANLSACEVKALSENQIRKERAEGTLTSTWVANQELQKEWLLRLGVTVITDLQFSGGNSRKSPRPQVQF